MHFYDFGLEQNMLTLDFAVTRFERFFPPQRDSAVVVKATCNIIQKIDGDTPRN